MGKTYQQPTKGALSMPRLSVSTEVATNIQAISYFVGKLTAHDKRCGLCVRPLLLQLGLSPLPFALRQQIQQNHPIRLDQPARAVQFLQEGKGAADEFGGLKCRYLPNPARLFAAEARWRSSRRCWRHGYSSFHRGE